MKFTDEEKRYLKLLELGYTFAQMAVELGMTPEEVEAFGDEFFERAFAERKKVIQ
jgi:hypothetical protein